MGREKSKTETKRKFVNIDKKLKKYFDVKLRKNNRGKSDVRK